MRRRNAEWFEERKEPETRMQSLFKEMWDRVHDLVIEAWKLYETADGKDLRLKSDLLGRVQRAVDMLRVLMMRVTPTMDEVENRRTLKDLEQRLLRVEENRRVEQIQNPEAREENPAHGTGTVGAVQGSGRSCSILHRLSGIPP